MVKGLVVSGQFWVPKIQTKVDPNSLRCCQTSWPSQSRPALKKKKSNFKQVHWCRGYLSSMITSLKPMIYLIHFDLIHFGKKKKKAIFNKSIDAGVTYVAWLHLLSQWLFNTFWIEEEKSNFKQVHWCRDYLCSMITSLKPMII